MEDEDIVVTKESDIWAIGMVFYVSFVYFIRKIVK